MNYNTYTLSELADIKYGKNQSKVESSSGTIPIYGTGGLMGYATRSLYDSPSILIGRKGSIDKVHFIDHPFWTVDTSFYTVVNNDLIETKYLYYLLSQVDFNNYNEGTTIPSLRAETLNRLEFNVPSKEIQRKIIDIVDYLDIKITVNKKINDYLIKIINECYSHIYENNDCDNVSYTPLKEICYSHSTSHNFNKEELIFLNTSDVENGVILHSNYTPVAAMPGQAKKTTQKNDILYSEIRPENKHFALVNINAEDYVVSTKLMVIRSLNVNPYKLYYFLTRKNVIDKLQTTAEIRSGTFPQITFDIVSQLKMPFHNDDKERYFVSLIESIYKEYFKLADQNIELKKLRNSLLPKLMSGEIDVSKLELSS